jgi:hypothetical protein
MSFAGCAYAMGQYSWPLPKHSYFTFCKDLDLIQ